MPVITTDPEPVTWFKAEEIEQTYQKPEPIICSAYSIRPTTKLKYFIPEKLQLLPGQAIPCAALVEVSPVPTFNWREMRVIMQAVCTTCDGFPICFERLAQPKTLSRLPDGSENVNGGSYYFLFEDVQLPTDMTMEFNFWVNVKNYFKDENTPYVPGQHGDFPPDWVWPEQQPPPLRLHFLGIPHIITGYTAGKLSVHTARVIQSDPVGNEPGSRSRYGADAHTLIEHIKTHGRDV
ncbi:hypothetical protein B0T20DRAFT_482414 [Sordaria brevicollis]|uniref:Uncharacterized protein n=1 Tax=Sordaria brevicollis TaxID=83679 RepID=A0AAE0P2U1_SORBR|nr:hypothetical protein B0T20DRAFT_482414 [Sordaria brevicollis]